jgi:putative spermidine/putrescine transport system permease protein
MTTSRLRPALNPGWLLLIPALVLLTAVLFIPLISSFWRSITDPELGVSNYTKLLNDGVTLRVMLRTAISAAVVTLVAFLLGYPYAYLMTRVGPVARSVLLTIVLIPFWTSALARNFGWLVLVYRGGPIQSFLSLLGFGEVTLYGTAAGVTLAMSQVMLPFMVLPLYSALGGIDRRLLLAARGLGSPPLVAFWKIYWPLSRAGAVAGMILVFTLSLGFYVTPALLGSARQSLIAQLLGQRTTELLDFAGAGALGTVVLVVTLALVAWANRLGGGVNAMGTVTAQPAGGKR